MDYGAEETEPAAEDEAYAPGGEEDAEMEDEEEPLNMASHRYLIELISDGRTKRVTCVS
jgi:hypothetical protein